MDKDKKDILRKYLPKIVETVDPMQLLPYLPCLSVPSKEEIETRQLSISRTAAASKLCEHLIRQNKAWSEFIAALRNPQLNYNELADLLDPAGSLADAEDQQANGPAVLQAHRPSILQSNRPVILPTQGSAVQPVPQAHGPAVLQANGPAQMSSQKLQCTPDTVWSELNPGLINILINLDTTPGLKGNDCLASFLDFTLEEYHRIKFGVQSGHSFAVALFEKWAARNGNCTLGDVMHIIDKMGRMDVLKDIKQLFGVEFDADVDDEHEIQNQAHGTQNVTKRDMANDNAGIPEQINATFQNTMNNKSNEAVLGTHTLCGQKGPVVLAMVPVQPKPSFDLVGGEGTTFHNSDDKNFQQASRSQLVNVAVPAETACTTTSSPPHNRHPHTITPAIDLHCTDSDNTKYRCSEGSIAEKGDNNKSKQILNGNREMKVDTKDNNVGTLQTSISETTILKVSQASLTTDNNEPGNNNEPPEPDNNSSTPTLGITGKLFEAYLGTTLNPSLTVAHEIVIRNNNNTVVPRKEVMIGANNLQSCKDTEEKRKEVVDAENDLQDNEDCISTRQSRHLRSEERQKQQNVEMEQVKKIKNKKFPFQVYTECDEKGESTPVESSVSLPNQWQEYADVTSEEKEICAEPNVYSIEKEQSNKMVAEDGMNEYLYQNELEKQSSDEMKAGAVSENRVCLENDSKSGYGCNKENQLPLATCDRLDMKQNTHKQIPDLQNIGILVSDKDKENRNQAKSEETCTEINSAHLRKMSEIDSNMNIIEVLASPPCIRQAEGKKSVILKRIVGETIKIVSLVYEKI